VHDANPESGLPWYRFFWPWFIVGLLATSVVAGLATLVIAIRNQDSLVDDRYYESGVAINRRLAAEANAERLGIRATVAIDDLTGEVHLDLDAEPSSSPNRLQLRLSHATESSRDATVVLTRTDAGRFYGQIDAAPAGRYYASLQALPATDDDAVAPSPWRLQREVRLPSRDAIDFGANPESGP